MTQVEHYYSRPNNNDSFEPTDPNYIKTITLPGNDEEMVSVAFSDGAGKTIQNQTWDGDQRVVISGKAEYNEIGKVIEKYQPRLINNSSHQYVSYLLSGLPDMTVTSHDGNSKIYEASNNITATTNFTVAGGTVEFCAGNEIRLQPGFSVSPGAEFRAKIADKPWRYESMTYETSPQARLKTQTHPDDRFIEFHYGAESFNGETYRYTKVTDEEGGQSVSYTDKFGNGVGGKDGIGTPDGISWAYEYDILGNQKRIKPSNFFNPPTGTVNTDWDSEITYNTLGQVIEEQTPDEGTTKCFYDTRGNLRFSQDAHQTVQGKFTAYEYDAYNRVTLVGEEGNDSWSVAVQNPDGNYGTGASEWKRKFYYNVNYVENVDNYCQGQLTKTEVNDDGDDAAEHVTKYIYDIYGNLIQKRITIEGLSEQVINHEYDILGREIELEYPSGETVVKEYDNLGRLKKVYTVQ